MEDTIKIVAPELMESYMGDISKIPLIDRNEERVLAEAIHGKDLKEKQRAINKLVESNLRLVVKIAHDFKGFGLPLADLVSEGNIGLMHAAEKFDPDKGAKFSSYAAWWIKQYMRRALANQSNTIRVPVQSANKLNKIRAVRNKLLEELGREPSNAEIAAQLDFSEKTVTELKLADTKTVSLHELLQSGEDGEIKDLISDPYSITPDSRINAVESIFRLIDLLDNLDDRERQIIELRFGLRGNEPLTLEEVSTHIGRTRERVRQLQNQALLKLKELLINDE